jgi:hypothetical protein
MPHSLSRRCPGETLVISLSGDPLQGLGTGWRAFPLLNLPVHRPLGPTRSSATSSSTRTPRTARPAPSPPTSSPWAGRHLLRRRGTCLAAPPGPTSRRSWPTRSPAGQRLPQRPQILYGWLAEEERSHQPDPVGRLVTPHGRTSWCSGGLEPPAFGFARRRLVPWPTRARSGPS